MPSVDAIGIAVVADQSLGETVVSATDPRNWFCRGAIVRGAVVRIGETTCHDRGGR